MDRWSRATKTSLAVALATALTLLAAGPVLAAKRPRSAKPDLLVNALALDPASTTTGSTIVATVTIKNAGTAAAVSTSARLSLASSATATTGAVTLKTVAVGGLAAGQQVSLTASLTIPTSTLAGSYYIQALADSAGDVSESNESNNLAAAPLTVTAPPASVTTMTIRVVDSLVRVQPTDAPGSQVAASIKAARNEYEAFRIVVTAPSGSSLTGVNVAVSDLVGPTTLSKSNIALYRAHYIPVATPSRFQNWFSPNAPGDWSDALIPSTVPGGTYASFPFTVSPGRNQPVWVEVYVPKGTPAGTYTGTATVTADQATSVSVPVTLTVWGFTLPERPSLASDFGTYDTWFSIASRYSAGSAYQILNQNLYAALSVHRLGLGVAALDTETDIWMRNHSHMLVHPDDTDATLRAIKAHFDANGWGHFLRHYGPDEPETQADFNVVKTESARFRSLGIPMMVTIKTPEAWAALDGFVDIWVPTHYELVFDRTRVADRLSRGQQVWSYTAGLNPNNAPTWLLDYDLIHYRIVPWLDYRIGLSGLLYWATAAWDQGDPWTNTGGHNQDGVFFYPGDRVGAPNAAIPSARLKAIRDGMEDYEYLTILAGLGDPGLAAQLAVSLAPAWDSWSHDAMSLTSARERAAARILELGGN